MNRIVKILWIDDSREWTESVQSNLDIIAKKYNVEFKYVHELNGEDIVQKCRSIDFDLILMDYDMTPFCGDKYIKDVRDEEHLEFIKILFYSQNNSVNLEKLIENVKNVECYYRPLLEDRIKELFFDIED